MMESNHIQGLPLQQATPSSSQSVQNMSTSKPVLLDSPSPSPRKPSKLLYLPPNKRRLHIPPNQRTYHPTASTTNRGTPRGTETSALTRNAIHDRSSTIAPGYQFLNCLVNLDPLVGSSCARSSNKKASSTDVLVLSPKRSITTLAN
jgi:hypothetical protein